MTSSPGGEVEAVLKDLQRLARVARDRHLLRIAAELPRQLAPDRLAVAVDQPRVVHRRQILHVEIALHRVEHDGRLRAVMPGVEIDHRAIDGERLLNLAPVDLVARRVGRRLGGDGRRRLDDGLEPGRAPPRERGRADDAGSPQKRSPCPHRGLLHRRDHCKSMSSREPSAPRSTAINFGLAPFPSSMSSVGRSK